MIGYTAPGNNGETTNFKFDKEALAEDAASATTEQANVWTATNKAKLNDCAGEVAHWTVSTGAIGSAGQDSYKAEVDVTECQALTPTFSKIGQ